MKNTIDKKELNIKITDLNGGYKAIYEFPMEMRDVPIDFKVEQMLKILNDCYDKTKNEIAGLFTIQEAWFLVATFNSYLYTSQLCDKDVLLANVEDAIIYEGLDQMFGIDKEQLLDKIDKLTEFQCFCVIRQAYEVRCLLNEKEKVNIDNSCDEDIKRIFGIK